MKFWIWLNDLKGFTLAKKKELLSSYKDPETIWNAFKKLGIVTDDALDLSSANEVIYNHNLLNIKTLTLYDAIQINPHALHEKWPLVCYYIGYICNGTYTSVIGTRNYSIMGYHYTERLCKSLVDENHILTTGLSKGIETLAIQKTMEYRGNLMVFATCGLDKCYPSENTFLFKKVKENYCVLSLYSCYTPVFKSHFKETNTFMMLWSNEVMVIEASQSSGSIKSALIANELGRKVYAAYDTRESHRNSGNIFLINEKFASKYNVSLPERLILYMQNSILLSIKEKPRSAEYLLEKFENTFEILLELEFHRLIQLKADGRWHYNGW